MTDKLTPSSAFTVVVYAGDIAARSCKLCRRMLQLTLLILNAAQIPEYRVDRRCCRPQTAEQRPLAVVDATDKPAVNITEILKLVPGRISTEVDARLRPATLKPVYRQRAVKRIIKLPYNDAGIKQTTYPRSGWRPPGKSICAVEQLEKKASTAT